MVQPLTVGLQCKETYVTGNSAVGLLSMHESGREKQVLERKCKTRKCYQCGKYFGHFTLAQGGKGGREG